MPKDPREEFINKEILKNNLFKPFEGGVLVANEDRRATIRKQLRAGLKQVDFAYLQNNKDTIFHKIIVAISKGKVDDLMQRMAHDYPDTYSTPPSPPQGSYNPSYTERYEAKKRSGTSPTTTAAPPSPPPTTPLPPPSTADANLIATRSVEDFKAMLINRAATILSEQHGALPSDTTWQLNAITAIKKAFRPLLIPLHSDKNKSDHGELELNNLKTAMGNLVQVESKTFAKESDIPKHLTDRELTTSGTWRASGEVVPPKFLKALETQYTIIKAVNIGAEVTATTQTAYRSVTSPTATGRGVARG